MIIKRKELLDKLAEASIGLTSKPILEQSDCFVFSEGQLLTFNDEILVRAKSPLEPDLTAAINANDLRAVLNKFPDEDVDVFQRDGELIIKAKRREAGISVAKEIVLPFADVPTTDKWAKLGEGVVPMLLQAARTCGQDASQFLTTCVHVTPDLVEACDNIRFFRATLPTQFPAEVLLPATCVAALDGFGLSKVSVGKGWAHFKLASGTQLTMRCSHETYHEGVADLLKIKNPEKVVLPDNLGDMVERSGVMSEGGHDARVGITISDGTLEITSRKETGWYRERKKLDYKGSPVSFDIHPKFLSEVLERTHTITVGSGRLKLEVDNIKFVVALAVPKKEEVEGEDNEDASAE